MKKKLFALLFAQLLFLIGIIPIHAQAPRLSDESGLLSSTEQEMLLKKLDNISNTYGVDVAVLTVDALGNKTATEYADDYYDENGFAEDGILLLLSMKERDWAISTKGFAIGAFTDRGQVVIMNSVLPYFGEDDYYSGFEEFVTQCDDFIEAAKNGNPRYSGDEGEKGMGIPMGILISLIIGAGSAFTFNAVSKSQLKSVHYQAAAGNYVKEGSINLTVKTEQFLYNQVVTRAKPKDNEGSGGSSTHVSSSGSRHGGSSGKF